MSTKFTPGPWSAYCQDVEGVRTLGDSGVRFWDIGAAGPYRGAVAQCHAAEHIGGITLAERDANARLIAAAPDLYEALEQVARPYGMLDLAVSEHVHGPRGDDMLTVAKIIRAALAKARGEQA